LLPDGSAFGPSHWHDGERRAFGCAFGGTGGESGSRRYILALNTGESMVRFELPEAQGGPWLRLIDTAEREGGAEIELARGAAWALGPHTLALFAELET